MPHLNQEPIDVMSIQYTLLARQPIFDRDLNISAYELLFRSDMNNQASFLDGDSATSQEARDLFKDRRTEPIKVSSSEGINSLCFFKDKR